MSMQSDGSGWWQASDGLWYPPELHPDVRRDSQDFGTGDPGAEPTGTGTCAFSESGVGSRVGDVLDVAQGATSPEALEVRVVLPHQVRPDRARYGVGDPEKRFFLLSP